MYTFKIAIIGLGYVGLPLAFAFQKKYKVIGYDISKKRIDSLNNGFDETNEITPDRFINAKNLSFSNTSSDLSDANVYIVTVPTPITESKIPDLSFLESASLEISKYLNNGDIVIYESTVYPGATEEICVPILEQGSSLKLNADFYIGYSPERINPGDMSHRIEDIKKITSGSNEYSARKIDNLYDSIIDAGTHPVSSIKVAEAAKVIENVQRDLNIGLVNELSVIFDKLKIPTHEVINAASTKWNFHKYIPGLVGGHCIGVDPYYLTFKSQSLGYTPDVILAGRKSNEEITNFIANKCIKTLVSRNKLNHGSKILVLGATFKENCPDTRNSKVPELCTKIVDFGLNVDIYDPLMSQDNTNSADGRINYINEPDGKYTAVIIAVKHNIFIEKGSQWIRNLSIKDGLIFDLKNTFPDEGDFTYL